MKDAMSGSPWLNAREAAQYLRVEPRTRLRWTREGKLRGFALAGTVRRVWRFRREDLDGMLCLPAVPQPKGVEIQ